jgi:CBS domain-containing protein
MSPRAAWRLENMGFTPVYDYVAGKVDWFAIGLPMEGELVSVPRAGDLARPDVPTCQLVDRVGDVRERVQASGWDHCVVMNDPRVVLGLLRDTALATEPRQPAEAVMEPGPTTIRPDVRVDEVVTYMQEHDLQTALITTSDGRLAGLLRRGDAEHALHEAHAVRGEPSLWKNDAFPAHFS